MKGRLRVGLGSARTDSGVPNPRHPGAADSEVGASGSAAGGSADLAAAGGSGGSGASGGSGGSGTASGHGTATGRWRRRARWLGRWLPSVLVVACAAPLVLTATAATTLLSADFYGQGLDRADAYDRVYSEVLPDPAVDGLLAGLPIDSSLVTANLRTVLPPSTVRGMTEAQIASIVDYLRAETDDVAFTVDLKPILANVSGLANRYLADEIGTSQTYEVETVREFTAGLVSALDAIAQGQPPTSLPRMRLTGQEIDRVLPLVLDRIPEPDRDAVAGPLEASLRSGDLAGGLALVGGKLFAGDDQAVEGLTAHLVDGSMLDVGVRLSDLREEPAISAVDRLHDVAAMLPWTTAVLVVLTIAGLTLTAVSARRRGGSPVRAVGTAVLVAGAFALVVGFALRAALPNPLAQLDGPNSPLPAGPSRVLRDVGDNLYGDVENDYLRVTVWVLVVGAVLVGTSLLLAANARLSQAGRVRRVAAYATVTTAVVVVSTWAAFPGAAAESEHVCNGHAQLCDRRYDDVVYAATHNAMANSEDRFLGPSQDPSMVHQLDTGVRALLVDFHHWTAPAEVEAFLGTLAPETREALAPLTRGATSQRPGVWLCHELCQLGSSNAVDEFTQLGDWMARNPTEVVTVVVQDGVDATEIAGVVSAAGLADVVATPPDDPHGTWPTLGEMVNSGRRLFVFTESQDLPGSYLRNFYRYAVDTPFDNRVPEDLGGCEVERGSADNPLLLVNHWLTDTAPSRAAALASNAAEAVVVRAKACESELGQLPTFVAVDFVGTGDLIGAVDTLNGVAG